MKNYRITVNGVSYDVTVEERPAGAAFTPAPAPVPAAPAPAPAAAAPAPSAAPAPEAAPAEAAAPAASGPAGSVKVEAGAAGKITKIEAKVGQAVKAGETVMYLEAMKMEIPVAAPQDGTVATIEVSAGTSVETGQVLATLN